MLAVGEPLPIDIWSESGQLLLRKGQPIVSEDHRDKLYAFNASATAGDAMAWQRAYERMIHQMLRDGVDVQVIAAQPMPSVLREVDYARVQSTAQFQGGWIDVQEVLRGILYQGGLAIRPLERLRSVIHKALELLNRDTDDSLFALFQLLADDTLGYCATNALLCACIGVLTARKLGLGAHDQELLLEAALTMNISMARDQDSMMRQATPLTEYQSQLVASHGERSANVLQGLGVDDADWLDLVRHHQHPAKADDKPGLVLLRQILHTADVFVAKMAARKTRLPLSSVQAVKAIYVSKDHPTFTVGAAMTHVLGFYPPGTYVSLSSGEVAVIAQRGAKANLPWLITIQTAHAMPVLVYQCCMPEGDRAIVGPLTFTTVKVMVQQDKVRRAREKVARLSAYNPP